MGSYTFMEGDYPGAAVAGANAQNHGSIMRVVEIARKISDRGKLHFENYKQ